MVHGKKNTYDKYKCRCVECVTEASRIRNAGRYALGSRIRGRTPSKNRIKKSLMDRLEIKERREKERRAEWKAKVDSYLLFPNLCANCMNPLLPSANESLANTKQRKFCGHRCSAIFNNSGNAIKRPQCSNGCGSVVKLINSKFCSQRCFRDRSYLNYIEKWKAGEVSGGRTEAEDYLASPVRRYILKKFFFKCSECGWGKINPITKRTPLNVDHMDGNPTNNSEDNLRTLCPNCHSLTPNFGSLNKGNGRATRRAKDLKYKYAKLV